MIRVAQQKYDGLGPKFQNKLIVYQIVCNEIVDICLYTCIYCFDRVDPNCTFRGNSVRFILEFLLSLIVMVLVCA